MIEVTTQPDLSRERMGWGPLRRSADVVKAVGPKVHNKGFMHTVNFWADGTVTLSAECSVIAKGPVHQSTCLGEVCIGDKIRVDGVLYEVVAQSLADPALIPAT
jgi:hypothetical protein